MGGDHDIGQVEQRAFGGRLNSEDVKGRACDMAGIQRCDQGLLVHQATPGAVHDAHALLHLRDVLGRDHAARLVGGGHMQRDEVGTGKELVQLNLRDAELCGALLGQEGIIGNHLHSKAQTALAHDAANVARADHA